MLFWSKSIAPKRRSYIDRGASLQRRRLDHLDPVTVRILDEGDVLHAAVLQALLERHAERFQQRARGADVGKADADMNEEARLDDAVVVDAYEYMFAA